MSEKIKVLDNGYVRLVECWGHGDAGQKLRLRDTDSGLNTYTELVEDNECGVIEAARQSTQASFRGWEDTKCKRCEGTGETYRGRPESTARCVECEGKGTISGDKRLLGFLFNSNPQHSTPFEFAGMVIEVQAPIFVFRGWHRHRTQSYNEMSARYAPLPDLNYMPTPDRCMSVSGTNKQAGAVKGSEELTHEKVLDWLEDLEKAYRLCEDVYQKGLRVGIPKEVARLPVPVGRYTRMRASTNLRNWLAFVTLRSDPKAQWEIRQFSNEVGKFLEQQFPHTWELFSKTRTKKET